MNKVAPGLSGVKYYSRPACVNIVNCVTFTDSVAVEDGVGTSQTSDTSQETMFVTFQDSTKSFAHLRMTITTLAVNCQQTSADVCRLATPHYSSTVLQCVSHLSRALHNDREIQKG